MAALLCLFGTTSVPQAASLSEIFYDAVGSDRGRTFIELAGTPGESLDDLVLVAINGSNGAEYLVIELAGAIPDSGVYLIADSDPDGGSLPDAELHTRADLQNGPDSLQLRRGDIVLDAVGYGDFGSAVFAGSGDPAPDVPAGKSLTRIAWTGNNAADYVASDPTPGIAAAPAPVPVPGALWLLGSGLIALRPYRRNRKRSTVRR